MNKGVLGSELADYVRSFASSVAAVGYELRVENHAAVENVWCFVDDLIFISQKCDVFDGKSLIKSIEDALACADYVRLADILEYEILDALEEALGVLESECS